MKEFRGGVAVEETYSFLVPRSKKETRQNMETLSKQMNITRDYKDIVKGTTVWQTEQEPWPKGVEEKVKMITDYDNSKTEMVIRMDKDRFNVFRVGLKQHGQRSVAMLHESDSWIVQKEKTREELAEDWTTIVQNHTIGGMKVGRKKAVVKTDQVPYLYHYIKRKCHTKPHMKTCTKKRHSCHRRIVSAVKLDPNIKKSFKIFNGVIESSMRYLQKQLDIGFGFDVWEQFATSMTEKLEKLDDKEFRGLTVMHMLQKTTVAKQRMECMRLRRGTIL